MKYSEIHKKLRDAGCQVIRKDAHHPIWKSPITGNTIAEAKEDFLIAYQEIKDCFLEMGKAFEEVEFVFCYDIPSFLQEFAYAFTLAGLERITGINQKQLGHYVSGYRKPSAKTVRKMEEGIHKFSEQLSMIHFVGA